LILNDGFDERFRVEFARRVMEQANISPVNGKAPLGYRCLHVDEVDFQFDFTVSPF
jgi:hypothetical protein